MDCMEIAAWLAIRRARRWIVVRSESITWRSFNSKDSCKTVAVTVTQNAVNEISVFVKC